jgi:hypothetical protein
MTAESMTDQSSPLTLPQMYEPEIRARKIHRKRNEAMDNSDGHVSSHQRERPPRMSTYQMSEEA